MARVRDLVALHELRAWLDARGHVGLAGDVTALIAALRRGGAVA